MLKINSLYNTDCLKSMKLIDDKSIDMIFTDLPYGTTHCKWDSIIDLQLLWEQYNRIIKDNGAILLFAQTPFDKVLGCSNLEMLRYEWIWEKTAATGHLNANRMPMKAHENILVFYKKLPIYNPQKTTGHTPMHSYVKRIEVQNNTEIYGRMNTELSGGGSTERYPRDVLIFSSDKQKSHLHSTQKPVALCEYMIKTYTREGDLVLDSCAGSMTTAIAAINTNRKYICMEKDKEIFNVGEKRVNEYLVCK